MADTLMRVTLLLLTNQIQPCTAPTNILKIDPPTVILTPGVNDTTGGNVTISCRPPNVSMTYMYLISITWMPSYPALGGKREWRAQTLKGEKADKAYLRRPWPGMSVTGSLAEKVVVLKFQSATCRDDGRYRCATSYDTGRDIVLPTKPTHNLSIEGKTSWTLDDTLNLTCHGPVGTVHPDTRVEFVWEYREKSTGIWSPFVWSPYDGNRSDLEEGPSSRRFCYENRTSILHRRISRRDHRRQYRCYVMRNNRSYEEFATAHYVGTVAGVAHNDNDTDGDADNDNDTDGDDDDFQPDGDGKSGGPKALGKATVKSTGIAVTAVAVGVVVLSIVIAVVSCRQRQRRAKNRPPSGRGSQHKAVELALEDTMQTTDDPSSMAPLPPMSTVSATSSRSGASTARSYSDFSSVSTSRGHSTVPSYSFQ